MVTGCSVRRDRRLQANRCDISRSSLGADSNSIPTVICSLRRVSRRFSGMMGWSSNWLNAAERKLSDGSLDTLIAKHLAQAEPLELPEPASEGASIARASSAASGILLARLWARRRCYPLRGRSGNVRHTSEYVPLRWVIERSFLDFLCIGQRKCRQPGRLEIQIDPKQQER